MIGGDKNDGPNLGTKEEPKIILWWLEAYQLAGKDFLVPPRIILVFDNETCKFFTSKSAADYVDKIDELFRLGLQGDLSGHRAAFKALAEIQSKNDPQS